MATNDTHIHTTPKGHEVRAEVVYDERGPKIASATVTHRHTGVIVRLDGPDKQNLREALYAWQLRDRAEADVAHLKAKFGTVEGVLGANNPALRDYQREKSQMEQFAEVARMRCSMLLGRVNQKADKVAEEKPRRR